MKIEEPRKLLTLQSTGDEGRLEVRYDNRSKGGLVEGVSLSLERPSYDQSASVFIEGWEVRALRDLLNVIAPPGLVMSKDASLLNAIADKLAAGAVLDESNREFCAQKIRDLIPMMDMADAYTGAREELAEWKKRALEAEAEIRELPTVEMVLLQADNYRRATLEDSAGVKSDLQHMLDGLPTDIVPLVKE